MNFCIKIFLFSFVFYFYQSYGIQSWVLREVLKDLPSELHVTLYEANQDDASVVICCHGSNGNYRIGEILKQYNAIAGHLISFNFPDADLKEKEVDFQKTSFGTIQELIPALYVIKQCVIKGNVSSINLYGFSAGGGALINIIAILNRSDYDAHLEAMGITQQDKQTILQAIQSGIVILDCSLKSIEEIIDLQGTCNDQLKLLAERYLKNKLRPIDSILDWQGLTLNVIIHFQIPDEILSNRDDNVFIQRIHAINKNGTTQIVWGYNEGHCGYHTALWTLMYYHRIVTA